MEYTIKLTWDPEAGVWIATSGDIPGLVLESGSFDALLERVRFAVPELLALDDTKSPLSLNFLSERHERLALSWQNMKSGCVKSWPEAAAPLCGVERVTTISGTARSRSAT